MTSEIASDLTISGTACYVSWHRSFHIKETVFFQSLLLVQKGPSWISDLVQGTVMFSLPQCLRNCETFHSLTLSQFQKKLVHLGLWLCIIRFLPKISDSTMVKLNK